MFTLLKERFPRPRRPCYTLALVPTERNAMGTTTDHAAKARWPSWRVSLATGMESSPSPWPANVLNLGFSDEDKARMHDLAVRNQRITRWRPSTTSSSNRAASRSN
jgi:hypothetical protein